MSAPHSDLEAGEPDFALSPPFRPDSGLCWTLELNHACFPDWDDGSDPNRSTLVLLEDGRPLGPAHAAHDEIRQQGGGRYSYWNGTFYFSSSNGSDPNRNGRQYALRRDPASHIDARIDYALGIVDFYSQACGGPDALKGLNVLEIGPGGDLGTIAVMAALGARVIAVERCLPEGWSDWHDTFFARLGQRLPERFPRADLAMIQGFATRRSMAHDAIRLERCALEELPSRYNGQVDLHVSNAALEHLYSLPLAFATLRRSCRAGARGRHQVDFRDHAHFGDPLRFLGMTDADYDAACMPNLYGRGNRVRKAGMERMLEQAGFTDIAFTPTLTAEAGYVAAILGELARLPGNRFAASPAEELRLLCGIFSMIVNHP